LPWGPGEAETEGQGDRDDEEETGFFFLKGYCRNQTAEEESVKVGERLLVILLNLGVEEPKQKKEEAGE